MKTIPKCPNMPDVNINPPAAGEFWYNHYREIYSAHKDLIKEFNRFRDDQFSCHSALLNQLSILMQSNANLCSEVQVLKDEIARLKGTTPRPKLPTSKLEGPGTGNNGNGSGGGNPGRGKHPRNNKKGLAFHNTVLLKPEEIPEDATYKGTRKYDVQDIIIKACNTRYLIERWELLGGGYIEGKLPEHVQGHFGVRIRALAIEMTHSCRLSEDLLLQWLHMHDIAISEGQLSNILSNGHDDFHAEKATILEAGVESGQIQTDDVGTLHRSKNCYTNIICSEFFVYMTTTDSKSRINFLKILAQGRNEYRFNQDAYDYLGKYIGTERLIQALKLRNNPIIETKDPEKAFKEMLGYVNTTDIRLLTEAGLVASLIEHGVPRDLNIHSDDASQFEIFKQSLCWLHEERHYRKLIPAHPEMATEIEKIRDQFWQLYNDLKAYKKAPSQQEQERLYKAFDDIFKPEKQSPYTLINDRLALTYGKRDRLLRVLENPATPLHNNLSEIGGRGAKIKSKISGGTRTDGGRQLWDTFGSLNLTCRRLGICFYEYLIDRFLNLKKIRNLKEIILERTRAVQAATIPLPTAGEELAMVLNTT